MQLLIVMDVQMLIHVCVCCCVYEFMLNVYVNIICWYISMYLCW